MDNVAILNAQITETKLGYDDHGILTFGFSLDISDGGCCYFGGYALDKYCNKTDRRICHRYSMEIIALIIRVIGVEKWEDLKGKYIRIAIDTRDCRIRQIANIILPGWIDIDTFIKNYDERCC